MAEHIAPQDRERATAPQGLTGWPDGWYVYENGHLNGPLSASETFTLPAEAQDGTPRLVSRKGFSQWYALKDLSEIFKVTGQMQEKVSAATVQAKKPGLMAKQVGPKGERPALPADTAPQRTPTLTARGGNKLDTPVLREAIGAPSVQPPVSKVTAKKAVVQEYFVARTRLRLGTLRNPWATALCVPVTLGIYWITWFVNTQREIAFHTQGSVAAARWVRLQGVLSVIPLVSCFFAYSLAKRIRSMEQQNKYQHISPPLAATLAVLLPFALGYIQSALNRHWLLHAKHVVMKRRSEAAAVPTVKAT